MSKYWQKFRFYSPVWLALAFIIQLIYRIQNFDEAGRQGVQILGIFSAAVLSIFFISRSISLLKRKKDGIQWATMERNNN